VFNVFPNTKLCLSDEKWWNLKEPIWGSFQLKQWCHQPLIIGQLSRNNEHQPYDVVNKQAYKIWLVKNIVTSVIFLMERKKN
jgi:hypothetical protein